MSDKYNCNCVVLSYDNYKKIEIMNLKERKKGRSKNRRKSRNRMFSFSSATRQEARVTETEAEAESTCQILELKNLSEIMSNPEAITTSITTRFPYPSPHTP